MSMKNKKIFSAMLIAVAMLLGVNSFAQNEVVLSTGNPTESVSVLSASSALYYGTLTQDNPFSELITFSSGKYQLTLTCSGAADSNQLFEIHIVASDGIATIPMFEGSRTFEIESLGPKEVYLYFNGTQGSCFYCVIRR